jgi:hypothetical protein
MCSPHQKSSRRGIDRCGFGAAPWPTGCCGRRMRSSRDPWWANPCANARPLGRNPDRDPPADLVRRPAGMDRAVPRPAGRTLPGSRAGQEAAIRLFRMATPGLGLEPRAHSRHGVGVSRGGVSNRQPTHCRPRLGELPVALTPGRWAAVKYGADCSSRAAGTRTANGRVHWSEHGVDPSLLADREIGDTG